MRIIHFSKRVSCEYPIGALISDNFEYIQEAASLIYKKWGKYPLHLVCRGSSGIIIATGIYTILKAVHPEITINIVISRKTGIPSHGWNMDGLIWYKGKIIVVDDFISTGDTIKAILKDLYSYSRFINKPYDGLVISNYFKRKMIDPSDLEILKNFKYVICNKIK